MTALSVTILISFSNVWALEVTSRKTDRHVMAPGTNAFFIPAAGLSLASSFTGFESKDRYIQVIVANFAAPLDVIAEGFTENSFKTNGMELKSRGEFTINGARAILFKVLHPSDGVNWGKWILLAENGKNTLEVNAAFVSGDAEAASDLETMLKGVYMEKQELTAEKPDEVSSDTAPKDVVSHDTAEARDIVAEENSDAALSARPESKSSDISSNGQIVSSDADTAKNGTPLSPEKDLVSSGDAGGSNATMPASGDAGQKPAAAAKNTADSGDLKDDNASGDVSPDINAGKKRVRIITEDGVISVEETSMDKSGE